GHAHAVLAGEADDLGAHLADVLADLVDVLADARADLDDRLVHLGLHPLLQHELALVEDLLYVRAKLARVRIDDLELLLDAERERGPFHPDPGQAFPRGRAGEGPVVLGTAGFRTRGARPFGVSPPTPSRPASPPARNVDQW